jgi:hypothetical protein
MDSGTSRAYRVCFWQTTKSEQSAQALKFAHLNADERNGPGTHVGVTECRAPDERQSMNAIRKWMLTFSIVAMPLTAYGQGPALLPGQSPDGPAFPQGTVVSSANAGPITVSGQTPVLATPAVGTPLVGTPANGTLATPANMPVLQGTVVAGNAPVYPVVPGHAVPVLGGPAHQSWLNNDCCGPMGGSGPMVNEIYMRFGPSFAFGERFVAKNMNTGWTLALGGRTLFFDVNPIAAWVVDVGVQHTYNNAGGQGLALNNNQTVLLRDVYRTSVGLGFGRDWFSTGISEIGSLRYGADLGARYGTGHVNLNPLAEIENTIGYRRSQDVFIQPYIGVHGQYDIPLGGWNLLLGGRLEYNFTNVGFMNASNNINGIDLLFTFGVRY